MSVWTNIQEYEAAQRTQSILYGACKAGREHRRWLCQTLATSKRRSARYKNRYKTLLNEELRGLGMLGTTIRIEAAMAEENAHADRL